MWPILFTHAWLSVPMCTALSAASVGLTREEVNMVLALTPSQHGSVEYEAVTGALVEARYTAAKTRRLDEGASSLERLLRDGCREVDADGADDLPTIVRARAEK